MDDSGGYIKLHRKLLDSATFSDPWLCKLWIWCLLKANWKPGFYKLTRIEAGSFACGRETAAEELGCSASKVYRGLKRLEELGQIELQANSRFTIITLCQWSTYQNGDTPERTASEQQVNNERTASEQRADTIEERQERKEGKEEEEETKNSPEPLVAAAVPAVVVFPIVGAKPGEPTNWALTDHHVGLLESAFGGVDVVAECRRALVWILANPTKRKTARGMFNFLRSWMERVQNRGPRPEAPRGFKRGPVEIAKIPLDLPLKGVVE